MSEDATSLGKAEGIAVASVQMLWAYMAQKRVDVVCSKGWLRLNCKLRGRRG